MQKFQGTSISELLYDVYSHGDSLARYTPETITQITATLGNISYQSSALTVESLRDIRTFGEAVHNMRSYMKVNSLWVNICHMRVIICETFFYNFIHNSSRSRCEEVLLQYSPTLYSDHSDWITRLILRVAYHLLQRESIHIKSSE